MKRNILLIVAIVALALPFVACGTDTGATGSAVTPQTTSTTSAAPKSFKVGDTVKIGIWTVKVNSAKTNAGGDFIKPKSGNAFLVINVTVTNTDSKAQTISSALNFKLSDSTGQSYTETVVDNQKNPPDGTVAANGKSTGELAFEVPKTMHNYELQFIPDITSTDQATWTLSV